MRKYDEDYKREAVKKIHDGQSVAKPRALGVTDSLFRSLPVDKLYCVFLDSDKHNGFTPKGVRFFRAKLEDNSPKSLQTKLTRS